MIEKNSLFISALPLNSETMTSLHLLINRVCTKAYRVWTKDNRVCTKVSGFFNTFEPCLDESVTVFARKHTVFERKVHRVCTKVYRVWTKILPCLHKNGFAFISATYGKLHQIFRRMYVSNLINPYLLLHTLKKPFLKNRVQTKGENRVWTKIIKLSVFEKPCLHESRGMAQ